MTSLWKNHCQNSQPWQRNLLEPSKWTLEPPSPAQRAGRCTFEPQVQYSAEASLCEWTHEAIFLGKVAVHAAKIQIWPIHIATHQPDSQKSYVSQCSCGSVQRHARDRRQLQYGDRSQEEGERSMNDIQIEESGDEAQASDAAEAGPGRTSSITKS
ncbi:hypothetical protein IF1G_09815 [Cordyceps javanica]|uniref:Uncharacterized protein n=1 Tax=Cordyceps javanica TaxID=43265 RepID=A0A545UQM0_9HYPO|nr:hypothetical protein IF1G_09815 [Cordyceps javanica]